MNEEGMTPEQIEFLQRIGALTNAPIPEPPPLSQEEFLNQIGANELVQVNRPNNTQAIAQGQVPNTFDPITYNQGVVANNQRVAEEQRREQLRLLEEQAKQREAEQSQNVPPNTKSNIGTDGEYIGENYVVPEDLNENNFLTTLLDADPEFREKWTSSAYYNKNKFLTEEIEKRTTGLNPIERERIKEKILKDNKQYLEGGYFKDGYTQKSVGNAVGDFIIGLGDIATTFGTIAELGLERNADTIDSATKLLADKNIIPKNYSTNLKDNLKDFRDGAYKLFTGQSPKEDNLIFTRVSDWLVEQKSDAAKEFSQANSEEFEDSSNIVSGAGSYIKNYVQNPAFLLTEVVPSFIGGGGAGAGIKYGVKKALPTAVRLSVSNNTVKRKVGEAVGASLNFLDRNAALIPTAGMTYGSTAQEIDRNIEGDLPLGSVMTASLITSMLPVATTKALGTTVAGRLGELFSAYENRSINQTTKNAAGKLTEAIATNPTLKNKIATGLIEVAKTTGSEGLEEGIENYVQTLFVTGYDEKGNFSTKNIDFNEANKQALLGASIGALSGALIGATLHPITSRMNRNNQQQPIIDQESTAPTQDQLLLGQDPLLSTDDPNLSQPIVNEEYVPFENYSYDNRNNNQNAYEIKNILDQGGDNAVPYKEVYSLIKYVPPEQIKSLSEEEIKTLSNWVSSGEVTEVSKGSKLNDLSDSIKLYLADQNKETDFFFGSLSDFTDSHITLAKIEKLAEQYKEPLSNDQDITNENQSTAEYIERYGDILRDKIDLAKTSLSNREFSFSSVEEKDNFIQSILEAKESSSQKIDQLKNLDSDPETDTEFNLNLSLQDIYDSVLPKVVEAPIVENAGNFTPSIKKIATSNKIPSTILSNNSSVVNDYNDYMIYLADKINKSSGDKRQSYLDTYKDIFNKREQVIVDTGNKVQAKLSMYVTPNEYGRLNKPVKLTDTPPEIAKTLVNNTSAENQYILSNIYPRNKTAHEKIVSKLDEELSQLDPIQKNARIVELNDTIASLTPFKKKRQTDLSIREGTLDQDSIIAYSKNIKATQNIKLAALNEITKKRVNNILTRYNLSDFNFTTIEASPYPRGVLSFTNNGQRFIVLDNKASNKDYEVELLYRTIFDSAPIIIGNKVTPTNRISNFFKDTPLLEKSIKTKSTFKKSLDTFLNNIGARVTSDDLIQRALKGNNEFSGNVFEDTQINQSLLDSNITKDQENDLTLPSKNRLVSDNIQDENIRSLFQSYYDARKTSREFKESRESPTVEAILDNISDTEQVAGLPLKTVYLVDEQGTTIGNALEEVSGRIEVNSPQGQKLYYDNWADFFTYAKDNGLTVSSLASQEYVPLNNLSDVNALSPIANAVSQVIDKVMPDTKSAAMLKKSFIDTIGFFSIAVNKLDGAKSLLDQAGMSTTYLKFVNNLNSYNNLLNPLKGKVDSQSYAGMHEALITTIKDYKKKFKTNINEINDYLLWREEQTFAKEILTLNEIKFTDSNFEIVFNQNKDMFRNGLAGHNYAGQEDLGGFKYQKYFDELGEDRKAGLEAIENIYTTYANSVYDLMNLKGMLSDEELRQTKRRGFWLSTQDKDSSTIGTVFRSGRRSKPKDPLEVSMTKLDGYVMAAYRNEALNEVFKSIMEITGNKYITLSPVEQRFNVEKQRIEVTDYKKRKYTKKAGYGVYEIHVAGKLKTVLIRDKKLSEILNDVTNPKLLSLGKTTQIFAMFKTVANPLNVLKYSIWDTPVAISNVVGAGNGKVVPDNPVVTQKVVRDMIKEGATFLGRSYFDRENLLKDPYFKYYVTHDLGISAGNRYVDQAVYKYLRSDSTPRGLMETVFNAYTKAIDPFESIYRFGIFKASLNYLSKGKQFKNYEQVEKFVNSLDEDIKQNLYTSTRKITIDFTEKGGGDLVNWFKTMIVFFNSIVQGAKSIATALGTKHGLLAISSLATLQFINSLLNDEDEELNERNIAFMDKYPLFKEFGVTIDPTLNTLITKLPMFLAAVVRDTIDPLDAAKQFISDAYNEVSPIQFGKTDSNIINTFFAFLPSITTPFLAAGNNITRYGSPIAPSYMIDQNTGKQVRDISNYLKYKSNDGPIAKLLAKTFYDALGVDISPSTETFLAKQFLGEIYELTNLIENPISYFEKQYTKFFKVNTYGELSIKQNREIESLYKKFNGYYLQYQGKEILSIVEEYKTLNKQREKALRQNREALNQYKLRITQDKSEGLDTEALTKVINLFYEEINQPLREWYDKYKDYTLQ
ncbi:MAG: hypothetical protein [Caudoviricetes sp.]|nr:MAG: hypothetical protein [Caudoviricetes sp.]